MKQKRVLMKDIAAKAGVHQTTVSLALRNHPSLPKTTRERIQNLANEMGYRPDPALSALIAYRQSSTKSPSDQVIALVVNFLNKDDFTDNHVHSILIKSARARAEELGYKVDVFWFGHEYPNGRSLDRVLKARNIEAVILAAFHMDNLDLKMDWEFYSVVKINMLPEDLAFDTVLSNQMFCVRTAMRKLREAGIKRVGLAVANHDEVNNRNMYSAGFLVGQRHLDPEDHIPPYMIDKIPTSELMKEVLDWARKYKLDAILSNWNNLDAVAYQLTVNEGHYCRFVPLDADERTSSYGGIHQNHELAGRRAVDMVVGQIKTFRRGIEESPSMTLIHPTWKELGEWPQVSKLPRDMSYVPGVKAIKK